MKYKYLKKNNQKEIVHLFKSQLCVHAYFNEVITLKSNFL